MTIAYLDLLINLALDTGDKEWFGSLLKVKRNFSNYIEREKVEILKEYKKTKQSFYDWLMSLKPYDYVVITEGKMVYKRGKNIKGLDGEIIKVVDCKNDGLVLVFLYDLDEEVLVSGKQIKTVGKLMWKEW